MSASRRGKTAEISNVYILFAMAYEGRSAHWADRIQGLASIA